MKYELTDDEVKVIDALRASKMECEMRGRTEAVNKLTPILTWTSGAQTPIKHKDLNAWILSQFDRAVKDLFIPQNSNPVLTIKFYQEILKEKKK